MVGKTLGHYAVSALIGRGGMGDVYRARDQKLDRDVAIKILPEEFATDFDRVARFQREAKLLASLNHPNIAAIYGLEESGGMQFLVLELVEGETLADQLKRGPIPVEESLKLALQIAEALEAAHEKGVIHRDLKPANIKVTSESKVKVLDFGLAKAFAREQTDLNLSNSPTLSHAATQQGVILGTAGYMSPEQARGKPVDKRTDIWAFGCVLYEMLTGRAAFQGEDVSEILASVIKGDANLDLLPAEIPGRVRELLGRCLHKDMKSRIRDIGDVLFELQQAGKHSEASKPATEAGRPSRLRLVLPWVAAAVILTAILAGVAVWRFKPPEPKPVMRFSYAVPANQGVLWGRGVAISPDGSRIAYSSREGLYLRSMDQLQAKLIAGSEAAVQDPVFSPDGEWIAFRSAKESDLRKIAVGGGSTIKLCGAPTNAHPSWGVDNTIVFDQNDRIMRVSGNGGTPEVIVEEKGKQLILPQVLPDGKTVLFTLRAGTPSVAVQSLADGKRKVLFTGDYAQYLPTGHIAYVVNSSLYAVPFDVRKLEAAGGPVALEENISKLSSLNSQYAISDSGTLVYVSGTGGMGSTLVWVDRKAREEAIDVPARAYSYARLSPDGTRGRSIFEIKRTIY